jgi:FtsP/CotA-like multicopper oxidase with cupredoxin domain
VHIKVYPGQSFEYVIPIPSTQPPGLYWYHAHLHGLSEEQVMGGLSGALVVEGFQEQFPGLANVKEHIFVLKDYVFEHSHDPVIHDILHDRVESVNGRFYTETTMRPGETQLWRFTNQSADLYFHIALKGHVFRIIGDDGVSANRETVVKTLDIKPAGRLEVLVTAGEPGEYDLVAEKSLMGTSGASTFNRVIGKLTVAGEKDTPVAEMAQFPERENLLRRSVDKYRVITFSEDVDKNEYYMNDKLYDEDRIDIRVPLGNTEEWVIRNRSNDMHVFHIHQVHFQVVEINGVPQLFNGYVDNVYVPEQGSVRIRIAFTDPRIVGRFVYHCHVLQHEDAGMMANIEVYDRQASQFDRLWKSMGYCCTGQFSAGCIWSNLTLLAKGYL